MAWLEKIIFTYSQLEYCTELEFKEKHGVWDPLLELTITSPYLIVDSEALRSTPTTTNADE